MTDALVRVGPVHFQSLERELEPIASYLSGHMLNAGCGTRDISASLRRHGVTQLTRYDLQSEDADVIVGPLEAMPFDDATFDSVLCNAVLEHVGNADESIRELARVVKPGGHIVVAIPFLQPFHPCPGDYRRYTADGLKQLGCDAGLEVVSVLPVHSLAQTIGWILWASAQEKRGLIRRALVFAFVFLTTRIWNRTDKALANNANTFQAVYRRPLKDETLDSSWRYRSLPTVCSTVPTMLVPDELRLLHYLARHYYTGAGDIVDAGSFLGGSTVALADGLRRNLRERRIHSYDLFKVEEWSREKYFPSMKEGDSIRSLFDRNTAPYSALIDVHEGDIREARWNGRPIEILFIDVAKHWTTCDWVTWQFFPHLIPGRSIVVQQDYLFHHWVAWLHVTMEYYADCFEYVCDTEVNSVAFLNTKPVPVREKTVESLSTDEKIDLMDRAAKRFEGRKRELLESAKTHFLEMLRQ